MEWVLLLSSFQQPFNHLHSPRQRIPDPGTIHCANTSLITALLPHTTPGLIGLFPFHLPFPVPSWNNTHCSLREVPLCPLPPVTSCGSQCGLHPSSTSLYYVNKRWPNSMTAAGFYLCLLISNHCHISSTLTYVLAYQKYAITTHEKKTCDVEIRVSLLCIYYIGSNTPRI